MERKDTTSRLQNYWIPSKTKLCELPCIEHELTGEIALVGRYGEIWEYDNRGNYRVVVKDSRIAKRLARKLGIKGRFRNEDEALFKFEKSDLKIVAETIEVYKTADKQIEKVGFYKVSAASTPSILNKKSSNQMPSVKSIDPRLARPKIVQNHRPPHSHSGSAGLLEES